MSLWRRFVRACRYARLHVRTVCILREPEDLVEEFEVDDLFDGLPGPDYNVAPTVAVPAVFERRVKDTGEVRRRLSPSGLGSGAVLGEGRLDRLPDDQRPARDGGREARLPTSLRRPPLSAAGGRLLRVVRRRADRRPWALDRTARASPESNRSSSTAPTAACW